MKKKMLFCIVVFLMVQIAKLTLISTYMQRYGSSRLEILLRKNSMLQYKQLQNNEVYLEKHPIILNQIKDVSSDWNEIVDVVGTNSYFEQLEHLIMVDGAFFGDEALGDERNVAVISDQLSISLCGTEKASGNIVHIQGDAYEIIGVYKKYRGLVDQYTDDHHEKIYVPITSSATSKQAVDHIIFDGSLLEAMPTSEELGKMGIDQMQMIKRDHTHWLAEIKSIAQLPMLVLVIILLWIGSCLAKKKYQPIYILMKENRNAQKYWILGKAVIITIGYIGIVIALFKWCCSNIYMSETSLPAENIFDLSFYWKGMKAEWAAYNQMLYSALQAFERGVSLLKLQIHSMNGGQYLLLIMFSVITKKAISKSGL